MEEAGPSPFHGCQIHAPGTVQGAGRVDSLDGTVALEVLDFSLVTWTVVAVEGHWKEFQCAMGVHRSNTIHTEKTRYYFSSFTAKHRCPSLTLALQRAWLT